MTPTALRGSIAPLVTPFTTDGELDVHSLRRITSWQIASGSDGISIGGSTGEPAAQTVAERIRAIDIVAEEISDRVPFVPGTGAANLEDTIEITDAAQDAGADAVLIITPYYAQPTQEGLYDWYATVATEFPDLPIAIYNVPSRTAVEIAPETVARLFSDFDNIIGIKETTKNFEHFSRVIRIAGPELMVWSGVELLALPLLAIGGVGMISAVANLAPTAVADLYRAWISGRYSAALDLHYRLHPLVDLLFIETNPAPVKWVLQSMGLLTSDLVRPPLCALSPQGKTAAKELLAQSSELIPEYSAMKGTRR
ncbi:4-hydroxy-tetrahydrodipicolinate synthase [Nocardia sp. NPDC051900]|uniref:4-hydroxy-tetrahydrodipicolinate synthase n=1 Tax=Nocardia sp. NPDC051900 TaxID=3364326 RepID=UPI00379089DB